MLTISFFVKQFILCPPYLLSSAGWSARACWCNHYFVSTLEKKSFRVHPTSCLLLDGLLEHADDILLCDVLLGLLGWEDPLGPQHVVPLRVLIGVLHCYLTYNIWNIQKRVGYPYCTILKNLLYQCGKCWGSGPKQKIHIKGSVSRDFRPPVFLWFEPIWAPDKQAKVFSNSISPRYSITKFEKFDSAVCSTPRSQNFRFR